MGVLASLMGVMMVLKMATSYDTCWVGGAKDGVSCGHARADSDRDRGARADRNRAPTLAGELGKVGNLLRVVSLLSY